MKELDFDFYMSQDAGRAFYRALIIYGGIYLLKNYSVSHKVQRCIKFIENEFWHNSKCYVQMRPRLRLIYSAFIASYVPFFTKMVTDKCKKVQMMITLFLDFVSKAEEDYRLFYLPNSILGFTNGLLISSLTLTFQPSFILVGGLIGSSHGLIFTYAYRQMIIRAYAKMSKED